MTVAGKHVDIGKEIASALMESHAVSSRLNLSPGSLSEAKGQMDHDDAYATVVIPSNLTASLLSAYDLVPAGRGKPTIQLLTNPRAGSIHVGDQLSSEAARFGRSPSASISSNDPITVATNQYRPLPSNSALGLSAFYISLLAIMCGFLGAILVNSTIDAALGYGTTEIGPRWRQRLPVDISRWQTLLAKWVVVLVVVPLLTAVLLLVAVGILKMDAPYVWLL